jgi:hypothetical protein
VTASSTSDPDSTPNNRNTAPNEDDTSTVSLTAFDVAVINEFVVNPTSGKEYVELLVTAPGGADLRGFTISDVGTRTGTTSTTEGDVTLGQDSYLSNVPQGTYVVIVLTTGAATNILTEDTSTSDGNRKLVLIVGTTANITTTGTLDFSTAENIQVYAGSRATGRVVDQVLVGGNNSYIFAPDGTTIQAPWGDNNGATTTDNINGSSSVAGNSDISFCPTADTLAEFQNNDTRTRFTITASSYGTPGAKNTCVTSDESINNH